MANETLRSIFAKRSALTKRSPAPDYSHFRVSKWTLVKANLRSEIDALRDHYGIASPSWAMLGFGLIFAFDIGLMVAHIIAADTAKDAYAAYAVIFSIVAFFAPLTAENRRYLERIAEDGRTYSVFFVLICAGATGAVAAHVAIHDPALVVPAFILAFISPFSRYLPKPIADRL